MSSAAQAIAIAKSQVGVSENPPGSNRTPYNSWYASLMGWSYYEACAWCAIFQCWVANQANSLSKAEMSAGAWDLTNKLKAEGRGLSKPAPGCLISFNYGSGHIGMVVALDPDLNYVYTVEGNTGASDGAASTGVYARRRYIGGNVIHGLAMPNYTDGTPPTVPVNKPTTTPISTGKLAVDGEFGPLTCAAMQRVLKVTADGQFGPITKRALQSHLHVAADGVVGPITIKALQKKVGAAADGIWGPATTRALQTALNAGKF